jgi:hypothetical protein
MAIVILGGLLSATALNMVVLPALYWLFGEREAAREAVALGDAWPAEAPLAVAAEGT